MADNTILNANSSVGDTIATKDISGVKHELVLLEFGDGAGGATEVSAANPLPVLASIDTTGLATEDKQDDEIALLTQIEANQQTDALTDTQLRATPVPISGTVTANTGLTQPLTDTQLRATPVPISGTVTANPPSSSSATLANVNDSASSVTLLASNASRKMATIFNDSTVALYVKFGATASLTSFTVKIAAQGYYELPIPVYTGVLDGIWDSDQSGAARVTEW
jgi:hypothetical protein